MKNLFSWSVVVSALTIYLYWYGYWYTEGYIRYFGHGIKAYDIPLQHIIVAGALQSLVLIFKLMMVLILISFLLQFSKNQYARFIKIIEIGLLYIFFNITELLKVILVSISKLMSNIMEIDRVKEEKDKWNANDHNYIKALARLVAGVKENLKCAISKINQKVNSIVSLNKRISCKKIIKTELVNNEIIKNKMKREDSTTFDTQYFIHTLIIFTIAPFVLVSLDYTKKVNESGFSDAHKSFECSIANNKKDCENYYKKISLAEIDFQIGIEESSTVPKNKSWYLTDICLNRRCLVFNENKVAKFADITDKEISME